MIEEIKGLYSQLDHKTNFTILAAEKFGKSPQSLRVHWFGNFWSIPEEYQAGVKKLLKETLKTQTAKV